MVELRQGRVITLLCVLFISCSAVDGNDDNATVEPSIANCNCELILILLHFTAGAAAAGSASIITLVVVVIYSRRYHCCRRCQQSESCDFTPSHTTSGPTDDNFTKGRISNVELWKLMEYSADSRENDKLSEAIKQLTSDISTQGFDSGSNEYDSKEMGNLKYFRLLCRWKDECAPTEQMDKLFEACLQANMEENVMKLKDFRAISEGVSEWDLKHILWQISKKSSENITTLLNRLTQSPFDQKSRLSENVHLALSELQQWTNGKHAINPAVMLSLKSDDLCAEDMYFFTVPDGEKRPLKDAEIKQHVRNVSRAHCKQIISIISTKGKYKRKKEEKDINRIIEDNEVYLFNTYQMIKEWLDEQECSNYEKRTRLGNAVEEANKASTSSEIISDEIEQLASRKGNSEAAYELLMKDIKPFAKILGLHERKLGNYKKLSSSCKSTRGTIGLVADVRPKTGKEMDVDSMHLIQEDSF